LSFSPALRKFALALHVTTSVGLLGAIAAFLALAVAGVSARDAALVRGAYFAMQLVARTVIVPLALAALGTGIVQALGTPWGLFRHYWVLIKLLVTAFAAAVLLAKLPLIAAAARMAAEGAPIADLRPTGLQLLVHASGGLAALLLPAILSVYKPRGLTRHGLRHQRIQLARP
jgi:hypothetical protein